MTSTTLPRSEISANLSGWRGGNGPHMVLIHGVGLTADSWRAMIPELCQHFSILAIDLPGHGNSAPLTSKSAPVLSDYSSTIAEVLTSIAEPAIIVGHSLGALIALDLAIRYPLKVAAVIPLNAIFRRTEAASNAVKERALELTSGGSADPTATLERWFGPSPSGSLIDAYKNCEQMLRTAQREGYATAYRVFSESDGPTDDEMRMLDAPVLCLTGAEEPNSTPAMSEALAALARDGQAAAVEGARHMMPLTHANLVNRIIIQFAKSRDLTNV